MVAKKIFMAVTAFISIVCFNFNKILHVAFTFLFNNIYDNSILTYGPYMRSMPVIVDLATIDGQVYTNKTILLFNWKWNFDISGITTSDLLILKDDASNMTLHYKKKYPSGEIINKINIDFKNKKITQNDVVDDIVFEEIALYK